MADSIEYYDSEQLILEVKKRPSLYDKNMDEYNDKFARDKLWKEICEAIVPNWSELSQETKERTGRDVQRKWKNIRDCFRKELNQQRRCKAGQLKRKRRKYIFYDQLLFLLPCIEDRERKYESAQSSGEEAEENTEETNTIPDKSDKTTYNPPIWKRKGRRHPVYHYDDSCERRDSEPDEIDEDKYFLLSLLPSFRILSPDQKFSAKIEFLHILRNVTCPSSRTVVHNRPSSPALSEQAHASASFGRFKDEANGSLHCTKQESEEF